MLSADATGFCLRRLPWRRESQAGRAESKTACFCREIPISEVIDDK
jgi:hypothetical protein